MRTFEEMREIVKTNRTAIMQKATQTLGRSDIRDFERVAANAVIKDCESNLENIDEVTTIEIGATTNALISAIQSAYKHHLVEYWQNYEKFLADYVVGLTPDGKLKNGMYFAQGECLRLGVNTNDLLCFKGCNPMNGEVGDAFRHMVNASYGTNIPMSGVEEQALREYEQVAFGSDELAAAQAFVNLKEVQRDSGALRNGGTYYTLATNQDYQNAKAICSGRSL